MDILQPPCVYYFVIIFFLIALTTISGIFSGGVGVCISINILFCWVIVKVMITAIRKDVENNDVG